MAQDLAPSLDLTREDRALLTLLQSSFPLVSRPFAALGDILSMSENAVIDRLHALQVARLLRRLGPVFEPSRFGLSSELLAARVAPGELDAAGAASAAWSPVTHAYSRDHPVNLWLAAIVPDPAWFEVARARLLDLPGVSGAWRLPALRRFKIAVRFDLLAPAAPDLDPLLRAVTAMNHVSAADVSSAIGEDLARRLLAALETDLPLTPAPFVDLAQRAETDEATLLAAARQWLADGRLRRYGALVSHLRLGFAANAMTVWQVPADRVADVGASLAASPHVSHCYERPAFPEFPYNLYAMVHARARDDCLALVDDLSELCPGCPRQALFSTQEFRKSSPRFADLLAGVDGQEERP